MVGQTVSHYTVLKHLGAGAMGEVYLAEDTRLGRRVALKFLPPHATADDIARTRFINEARAASSLDHPNVCTIHDIEETAGRLMLVMAFCDGESLKSRIGQGSIPPADAVDICAQIAEGLAEAHARGIVHRDVKPANIMVTRTGHVKIVDFGIARVVGSAAVTMTGMAVGTPAYMAPEQLRGETVDARADLWALGVVLYEMIAGRPPFAGASIEETLYAVLHRAPEPIERAASALPPAVAHVVSRALMKDPLARYQQAEQMLADLQACRQQLSAEGRHSAPVVAERRLSIAVLPFANLSADKEQEYFCDGMTEEITTALGRLRGLRVVAHTSAMQFKGQAVDIRRVGELLNVQTVVEGSVRKAGSRLRVTAQVANTADGYHVWSERYDRDLNDVFAVQDEIARAIAETLGAELRHLTGAPLVRPRISNMEAYQLYLKGRYLWARRYSLGPEPARKCFAQAVALAPDFPAALAGVGDCYLTTGIFSLAPIRDMLPKAAAAVERALALDEACAEAHHTLGSIHLFFDWNWQMIERGLTRALELNPDLSITRGYRALALAMMGRGDDALREADAAVSLDPLSAFVAYLAGSVCYCLGLHQRAINETQRSAELDPHMVLATFAHALALSAVGRHDEAIDAARAAVTSTARSPFMVAVLSALLGEAGKRSEARVLLDELSKRREHEYVSEGILSIAYTGVGDWDATLAVTERAVADRDGSYPWLLFAHTLDPIRRDPRYLKILENIGYTGTSKVLLGDAQLG